MTASIITDAEFQRFLRNEDRVRNVWDRIKSTEILKEQAKDYMEL